MVTENGIQVKKRCKIEEKSFETFLPTLNYNSKYVFDLFLIFFEVKTQIFTPEIFTVSSIFIFRWGIKVEFSGLNQIFYGLL
jgi:hypothetical protein